MQRLTSLYAKSVR